MLTEKGKIDCTPGGLSQMTLFQTRAARPRILEQVKTIVLEELADLPAKVCLFGSWARVEEKAGSDIDVGLCSETPLPHEVLTRLRLRLEESTIPYRVDVVDLHQVDPAFIANVRRDGILWKED